MDCKWIWKKKNHHLNKLSVVDGLKWISITNICIFKLAISYVQPILDMQVGKLLEFRSMVRTKESEEKKRIQISEGRKYIMYKSASVPLLSPLILIITIYYVILLLYNQVKCIKPTMDHVSFKYNWKHSIYYILYKEKRFTSKFSVFRAWTDLNFTGINHLGSWWTTLGILDTLKIRNIN